MTASLTLHSLWARQRTRGDYFGALLSVKIQANELTTPRTYTVQR